MPAKALIPLPQGTTETSISKFRDALQDRKNSLEFPTTTRGGYGSGASSAPVTDWKASRLKPDPSEALVQLCRDVPASVGLLFGIPVVLTSGSGETQTREAFRRFVASTIQPLASLTGEALTAALSAPVANLNSIPARSGEVVRSLISVGVPSGKWYSRHGSETIGTAVGDLDIADDLTISRIWHASTSVFRLNRSGSGSLAAWVWGEGNVRSNSEFRPGDSTNNPLGEGHGKAIYIAFGPTGSLTEVEILLLDLVASAGNGWYNLALTAAQNAALGTLNAGDEVCFVVADVGGVPEPATLDTDAAVAVGAPGVSAGAGRVAAAVHEADAALAVGGPDVDATARVVARPAATNIQTARLAAGAWMPRTNPPRAVMPLVVTCEGPTEDLCPAICRELSARLDWCEVGATVYPADAAPHDTGYRGEYEAGAVVVSLDPNQSMPEFEQGDPEPSISEVRILLTQPTTGDSDDLDLFIARRADLRRVLSRLNGGIGA